MKFVADVMLGKLAKRLRLLGHDVLYDRTLTDHAVIRISLEENRIILTRDSALAKRPLAQNHLLISDDAPDSQLKQVLTFLGVSSAGGKSRPLTRCSLCNEVLASILKKDVRESVPAFVYDRHRTFLRCPRCNRIYWTGTHTERMGLP